MYKRTNQIDVNQSRNVWMLYKKHPIVGICTRAIQNAIFSDEISGLENYKQELRPALRSVAHGATAWIFCIGLVPIVLNRSGKGGEVTVHIPDRDSVAITVTVDGLGKKSFAATFNRDAQLFDTATSDTSKVLIWSKCPNVPESDGTLTTAITRLESGERFSKFLHQKVMVAESLKSNPYHVTQARVKPNTDTDGVMWNVGDDVVREAEVARLDTMESTQLHQYATHTDNWGDMNVGPDQEVDKVLIEGCKPREYYLSAEREMARPQPVASAVAELSHVSRASDERVYNIFGIPMAMFTQNSAGNNTGVNHLQEYVFNATVQQHKKCIEDLINDVGMLIGQSFDMFESSDIVESTTRNLQLRARACMSLDQVHNMLKEDILSKDEASTIIRDMLMLPKRAGDEAKQQEDNPTPKRAKADAKQQEDNPAPKRAKGDAKQQEDNSAPKRAKGSHPI